MRRLWMIPLAAVIAACGEDATAVMEPVVASSLGPQQTATTWIDGVQYEYGCPDFPCPVTQIVRSQIDNQNFFWLPKGQFPNPTIYLPALAVPVSLRPVVTPPPILPPVIGPTPPDPTLSGKKYMTGYRFGPLDQIVCNGVLLTLTAPDGGNWEFQTGTILYQYGAYDPWVNAWVPTGATTSTVFGAAAWAQMLAGTYGLYPQVPNAEYKAKFTVNLSRGTHTTTVEHTIACKLEVPAPPAPYLDGPVILLGTRAGPGQPLICSDVELTLTSPDGLPWYFDGGELRLETLGFDAAKNLWYPSGNVTTSTLSSGNWQDLLDALYDLNPGVRTGPYLATFTVDVERGRFDHTLTHTVGCAGVDYYNWYMGQNGAS